MQVDWKLSLTATEVTEARIKNPAKLGTWQVDVMANTRHDSICPSNYCILRARVRGYVVFT
jgi:hypothetical protein